jgi:hypothetical protein
MKYNNLNFKNQKVFRFSVQLNRTSYKLARKEDFSNNITEEWIGYDELREMTNMIPKLSFYSYAIEPYINMNIHNSTPIRYKNEFYGSVNLDF